MPGHSRRGTTLTKPAGCSSIPQCILRLVKVTHLDAMKKSGKPVRIGEQAWAAGTRPLLTIWCIAYNHADYIIDAIDGFLLQETTFPVEVLLHDDGSSDGTGEIALRYQSEYPQLFRAIVQKENQLSKGIRPIRFLAPQTCGQFVAICEGDDYWTDPLKLQKQVSLLELNPEASGTFHPVSMIDELGREMEVRPQHPVPPVLRFRDIVSRNHLLTCSLVFRSSAVPQESSWCDNLPMGDWPLQVNLARSGDLLGLPDNMGCYRRHGGGIWTRKSKSRELEDIDEFYESVEKTFKGELTDVFYSHLRRHRKQLMLLAMKQRNYLEVFRRAPAYFGAALSMAGASLSCNKRCTPR